MQSIKMIKKQKISVVNKVFDWLIPNLRAVNLKTVFRRNILVNPLLSINSRGMGGGGC